MKETPTAIYKIRLMPMDKFFFGSERTFGADNADYFVRSNPLPQQTALLGLLRYKLLEMRGWLVGSDGSKHGNPAEISELIGLKGFDGLDVDSYGCIQSLSPCFLESGANSFWLPGPKNRDFLFSPEEVEKGHGWHAHAAKNDSQAIPNFLEKEKDVPSFDPKEWIAPYWVSSKDWKTEYTLFRTGEQVGILKNRQGETEDDGFFRQVFLKFPDRSWSFTFFAEMAEAEAVELEKYCVNNTFVPFGGERSMFRFSIEKGNWPSFSGNLTAIQQRTFPAKSDWPGDVVVLLSDAFLPFDALDLCALAVTGAADFRHLLSDYTNITNYSDLDSKREGRVTALQKSDRHLLVQRGSAFYVEAAKSADFCQKLRANRAFRQIGYNSYALFKKGGQPETNFFITENSTTEK